MPILTPKPRSVPEVLSLRLPADVRRRFGAAIANLPLFSRHAIALTAFSAGLDSVSDFAAFAAASVKARAVSPKPFPRQSRRGRTQEPTHD